MVVELRQAMAQLGWVEGSNLSIEWRSANGDPARMQAVATAMAHSGVDAIFTGGGARVLHQATTTVPIIAIVGDPIGQGYAKSLGRPGGNMTGISLGLMESVRMKLQLLREIAPRLTRLTAVMPATWRGFEVDLTRAVETAARDLSISTRVVVVENAQGFRDALARSDGEGRQGIFALGVSDVVDPKEVAAVALRANVPTIFDDRTYVDAGGLMSYVLSWDNPMQHVAAQIDKVLRGAHPAQIPFEFPTTTELIINARTAKALGLTISFAMRMRADEVIE